jgi:transposase-like protein
MGSTHCPPEGIFLAAKKGQTCNRYTEETKKEAVRLFLEEGFSYAQIQNQLGIKSSTQIINWVNKHNSGESFEMEKCLSRAHEAVRTGRGCEGAYSGYSSCTPLLRVKRMRTATRGLSHQR